MAMYSKLVKCQFGYHTPINRICKGRELEERMYDTKFGKICINCYRLLDGNYIDAKKASAMINA